MRVKIIDKDNKREVATFEDVVKVEREKIYLKYFEETPTEFPAECYEIEVIK